MLVIDTFSFWAQFEGERENWSGETQRAMDRLDGPPARGCSCS